MKEEIKTISFLKKILAVLVLITIIMCTGIWNLNNVQAAKYSNKYISIEIPDKYENYYSNIDEDSLYESYHYLAYGEYIDINYNVYERIYVEYTQSYLDEYVLWLKEYSKEYNYSIEFIHQKLVEINGCKGMRVAYKQKDLDYGTITYQDEYYFITDKYEVELSFSSLDTNFIDTKEEQDIVKSLKIKDTVLKTRGIPFTDVATNAWYYNAVKYSYTNNMIKGLNDYTYGPTDNLTRGMLVTILYRMEGSPKVTGANKFKDVASNMWYSNAVNWAASNKIVNGYGNGKFGPEDKITREQLAVMLRSYANYKKKDTSKRTDLTKFTDNKYISSYAKDSVSWAVANKIISGKSNGTKVDPYGKATRAEVATMLYSFCMNIK